jgi:hypothetical protein
MVEVEEAEFKEFVKNYKTMHKGHIIETDVKSFVYPVVMVYHDFTKNLDVFNNWFAKVEFATEPNKPSKFFIER